MWKITKEDASFGRVGYSEQHSRVSVGAMVAGFVSEDLPSEGLELVRFRVSTGDDEIIYWGELHDDDECANQDAALSFAMSDVGCTKIEVYRNGEWVQEIA